MTAKLKITKKGSTGGEEGLKRHYFPGHVITDVCPNCTKKYKMDLGEDYLSFPESGIPYEHTAYCGECDHEWSIMLLMQTTLEIIP